MTKRDITPQQRRSFPLCPLPLFVPQFKLSSTLRSFLFQLYASRWSLVVVFFYYYFLVPRSSLCFSRSCDPAVVYGQLASIFAILLLCSLFLSSSSSVLTWSYRLARTILRRHVFWNTSTALLSPLFIFQVSHTHSKTGSTSVSFNRNCSSWNVIGLPDLLNADEGTSGFRNSILRVFHTSSLLTHCCSQVNELVHALDVVSIDFDRVMTLCIYPHYFGLLSIDVKSHSSYFLLQSLCFFLDLLFGEGHWCYIISEF